MVGMVVSPTWIVAPGIPEKTLWLALSAPRQAGRKSLRETGFCSLGGPEGAAKVAIRPVDVYVDMDV